MPISQQAKAEAFRALHRGPCFVMPNLWDAGSARALAGLGFAALATSSGAAAGVLGRRDAGGHRDPRTRQLRLGRAPVMLDITRR